MQKRWGWIPAQCARRYITAGDRENVGRGKTNSLKIKEFNSGLVSQARTVLHWLPEIADFKITVEQRKEIAVKLNELQISQRATAKMLGVGQSTVHRDTSDSNESNRQKKLKKNGANNAESDSNESPWFQSDINPGQVIANKEAGKIERAQKLENARTSARLTLDMMRRPIGHYSPRYFGKCTH